MLIYAIVNIRRSELCTINRRVSLWELPILEAVHEGAVTVTREIYVDKAAPSAQVEYERLTNLYKNSKGEDGSIGIPYVASVYGNFGTGVRALERAIAAATKSDVEATDMTEDLLGVVV